MLTSALLYQRFVSFYNKFQFRFFVLLHQYPVAVTTRIVIPVFFVINVKSKCNEVRQVELLVMLASPSMSLNRGLLSCLVVLYHAVLQA